MSISSDLIGQRQLRLQHTQSLRDLGIDPYPAQSRKDVSNSAVTSDFASYQNKTITLAGRLMGKREHGKLMFGDLVDQSGKIQICIKKDEIQENLKNGFLGWDKLTLVDTGDFVQVTGNVDKTQQGEVTLFATTLRILSKSIRPLPLSITSKEDQFRRRYIDIAIHPERKELFQRKARFWKANREFMQSHGFIEVETPILEHITGGADAKPFSTHHNALDQEFYLRISTELYQKRLIGSGFEKIFTVGPNFRNEGLSDEHLQEFYQIEWYWAYADYQDNMNLVTDMFRSIALDVYGKTEFTTRGHTFDLSAPWQTISYPEIIQKTYGIDIFTDSEEKMLQVVKSNQVELSGVVNRNRIIDNLWKLIRKTISGPAFLINEPAFMSPLAKSKKADPRLTERFHVLLAGSELGNGYSEINDPLDQLDRFLGQQQMRDSGDDEAQMLDIDFVEMLEYGMPPTSGYAHSERLFWFLEGVTAREGTLFPQMRHEVDEMTKKIYAGKVKFEDKRLAPPKSVDSTVLSDPTSRGTKIQNLPSREEALKLLEEHVKEPYQILHAKMVAAAMESYAEKWGENADLWYITGLLHDLDYHKHPDEHPNVSIEWFKKWEYPAEMIQAICAHAHGSGRTQTPPQSRLDFALIACDELSGLMYAYSLMRPERFAGMETKSVIKKFKNKGFAAKIDREEIMTGVNGLGITLEEHIAQLLTVFSKTPLKYTS